MWLWLGLRHQNQGILVCSLIFSRFAWLYLKMYAVVWLYGSIQVIDFIGILPATFKMFYRCWEAASFLRSVYLTTRSTKHWQFSWYIMPIFEVTVIWSEGGKRKTACSLSDVQPKQHLCTGGANTEETSRPRSLFNVTFPIRWDTIVHCNFWLFIYCSSVFVIWKWTGAADLAEEWNWQFTQPLVLANFVVNILLRIKCQELSAWTHVWP